MDEATGAHFQYEDIFQRLIIAKVERNRTDMELKISYSSQNEDEKLSPMGLGKQEKKYKQMARLNDQQPVGLNKTNSSIKNASTTVIKPQKQESILTKSNKYRNQERDYSDGSVDEIQKHQF